MLVLLRYFFQQSTIDSTYWPQNLKGYIEQNNKDKGKGSHGSFVQFFGFLNVLIKQTEFTKYASKVWSIAVYK